MSHYRILFATYEFRAFILRSWMSQLTASSICKDLLLPLTKYSLQLKFLKTIDFVSLFVSSDYRAILWGSAAISEYIVQYSQVIASLYLLQPPKYRLAINVEHMNERMGLLTLMVLGGLCSTAWFFI